MRFFAPLLGGLVLLAAGCSSEPKLTVQNAVMGQRIQIGPLIYNVFDSRWLTQIGEGATARIPEHRFFLVRMSVVNSGGGELLVPPMTITDDQGNTYQEVTNGDGVPQWMGYLRKIRPADTLQGNVIFDAPAKHYKLKLSDESELHTALVDLPLTFNAEAPELPPSQQSKPVIVAKPGDTLRPGEASK